jgi:tetratricopeptide (TPR) repeat protein
VLELDPQNLGALLALEPMLHELGEVDALIRVLEAQARVAQNPGARVAALHELLRLLSAKGRADEEIRRAALALLELAPEDLEALAALERVAMATRDSRLLAHVDAKMAGVADEPALSAAHQARLAEELELCGDGAALELFRSALSLDPNNIAAGGGLLRMAERSSDPALLEEAAEAENRVTGNVEASANALLQSAEAYVQRRNAAGATRALRRALELCPDHAKAAELACHILGALGQFDALIDSLSLAARSATNPERSADLWVSVAALLADEKHDVPAGLAALNRVEKQLTGHVPVLLKLAELYERDGQWTQAVDRLTQVVRKQTSAEQRTQAHLQLATILDERLNDDTRARTSLDLVLKDDPDNRKALRRLLALEMRQRRDEAAAAVAARLVKVSTERGQKAEALWLLGQLERNRKQFDAAVAAYEQAVGLIGTEGKAQSEFRAMLAEQPKEAALSGWKRYADALHRYIEQGTPTAAAAASAYLELGRALGDELRQPEQAAAILRRGLDAAPQSAELRTQLAMRLKRAGMLDDAVKQLRLLLDVDVMREQTWRDLAECFTGMQRMPEAVLAIAPLVALGKANDFELASHAARATRPANLPADAFDAGVLAGIDALPSGDRTLELLVSMAEAMPKIVPSELERFGLSGRDKISARSGNPLRSLADRVADIFGVDDYDLYLAQQTDRGSGLFVELSDPVSVIVPAFFANLTESQQVFLLARVMANIARRIPIVDRLAPESIEVLVASAARTVDASFGGQRPDEELLALQSKRIHKAVSWGRRRGLEDAAQAFVSSQRMGLFEWVARARATAARAALLVADDLPGAVTLVRQLEGDLAGLQGAQLAQGMAIVEDLLRFWISDAALALRRRFGV